MEDMMLTESLNNLNLVPLGHSTGQVPDRPPVDIVVLASSDSVSHGLRRMAHRNRWSIHPCATLCEATRVISRLCGCIVLCESRIADTSWRDVLKYLQSRDISAPLVVFTHFADVNLWLDVLDAGGHDVVLFPFGEREVVHVLGSACRELASSAAA